eukprot:scaffold15641_cov55-Phaeocystis_antarctica.AAC.1
MQKSELFGSYGSQVPGSRPSAAAAEPDEAAAAAILSNFSVVSSIERDVRMGAVPASTSRTSGHVGTSSSPPAAAAACSSGTAARGATLFSCGLTAICQASTETPARQRAATSERAYNIRFVVRAQLLSCGGAKSGRLAG